MKVRECTNKILEEIIKITLKKTTIDKSSIHFISVRTMKYILMTTILKNISKNLIQS